MCTSAPAPRQTACSTRRVARLRALSGTAAAAAPPGAAPAAVCARAPRTLWCGVVCVAQRGAWHE
eukprot:5369890-Prymnesium_polylepis.1